jgi:hypothetical protein
MKTVNVHEAKTNFSSLLAAVEDSGGTFVICRNGAPVADKLRRMDRGRLARECAKLDPKFEQALADEGIGSEMAQWPEY